MKRVIICLMLVAMLLGSTVSVHAADAEITVQVRASKTEVFVGDTVEFTVLATGSGVVAMQFNLECPEGLTYVPNSGATPENLAQKLGVPAADWTELSKMFTFYNDMGITFADGTEILRFTCVAEKEGEWAVDLYELLPFDENFEEFTPKLHTQIITVRGSQTSDGQTDPVAPDEDLPVDSVPGAEGQPDNTVPGEETKPADDLKEPEDAKDTLIETPADKQEDSATPETEANDRKQPVQVAEEKEDTSKNNGPWIIAVAASVLIGGGVVAFILIKKKNV